MRLCMFVSDSVIERANDLGTLTKTVCVTDTHFRVNSPRPEFDRFWVFENTGNFFDSAEDLTRIKLELTNSVVKWNQLSKENTIMISG